MTYKTKCYTIGCVLINLRYSNMKKVMCIASATLHLLLSPYGFYMLYKAFREISLYVQYVVDGEFPRDYEVIALTKYSFQTMLDSSAFPIVFTTFIVMLISLIVSVLLFYKQSFAFTIAFVFLNVATAVLRLILLGYEGDFLSFLFNFSYIISALFAFVAAVINGSEYKKLKEAD